MSTLASTRSTCRSGDDHCGNCLVVDLRDGSEHGLVRFFDHEGGDPRGFFWRSVTEMLADLREALLESRPSLSGHALRTLTSAEAPHCGHCGFAFVPAGLAKAPAAAG